MATTRCPHITATARRERCSQCAAAARRRPRPLGLADFADLYARASAAVDAYARADDGGHPGSAAARAYRAERDACWDEAAARAATLVRLVNGGAA
jgi:hypothetical protein